MKKVALFVLTFALIFGGIITLANVANQSTEGVEVNEHASGNVADNLPPLHYYHEDKYPAKEDLQKFHIFSGQFPLEDKNGTIPLHNFNTGAE
jgi:hypothetical protein